MLSLELSSDVTSLFATLINFEAAFTSPEGTANVRPFVSTDKSTSASEICEIESASISRLTSSASSSTDKVISALTSLATSAILFSFKVCFISVTAFLASSITFLTSADFTDTVAIFLPSALVSVLVSTFAVAAFLTASLTIEAA